LTKELKKEFSKEQVSSSLSKKTEKLPGIRRRQKETHQIIHFLTLNRGWGGCYD